MARNNSNIQLYYLRISIIWKAGDSLGPQVASLEAKIKVPEVLSSSLVSLGENLVATSHRLLARIISQWLQDWGPCWLSATGKSLLLEILIRLLFLYILLVHIWRPFHNLNLTFPKGKRHFFDSSWGMFSAFKGSYDYITSIGLYKIIPPSPLSDLYLQHLFYRQQAYSQIPEITVWASVREATLPIQLPLWLTITSSWPS